MDPCYAGSAGAAPAPHASHRPFNIPLARPRASRRRRRRASARRAVSRSSVRRHAGDRRQERRDRHRVPCEPCRAAVLTHRLLGASHGDPHLPLRAVPRMARPPLQRPRSPRVRPLRSSRRPALGPRGMVARRPSRYPAGVDRGLTRLRSTRSHEPRCPHEPSVDAPVGSRRGRFACGNTVESRVAAWVAARCAVRLVALAPRGRVPPVGRPPLDRRRVRRRRFHRRVGGGSTRGIARRLGRARR